MATLPVAQRLTDISPRAFEHPADRAASAALAKIPMLDSVLRRLIELGYERALRQGFLASSVRVGTEQLPELWRDHVAACTRLDLEPPTLYLTQFPLTNAAAIGAGTPMVVVNSRCLDLFEPQELRSVLGHEAGHLLADHVLYRTALMILLRLGTAPLPALGRVPLMAIQMALLEWFRAAELSCDRASALVTGDPLAVCQTMMVMAGGAASRRLDLQAFVNQAAEYEDWGSGWDRINRLTTELSLTHSYPVRRVSELMRWVRSGDYDRIMAGEYLRRGQERGARAEASEAADYYGERFRTLFEEAGAAVAGAGDQMSGAADKMSEWLRRT